jgi:hypothetical protein
MIKTYKVFEADENEELDSDIKNEIDPYNEENWKDEEEKKLEDEPLSFLGFLKSFFGGKTYDGGPG